MSPGEALDVFRTAILMILRLASPLLFASITIGLIISVFQAATQIHEQTLTFVPKILTIALILIVTGSWMLANLQEFFVQLTTIMAGL